MKSAQRVKGLVVTAIAGSTMILVGMGDSCSGDTVPAETYVDESCPGGGCDVNQNPAGSNTDCGGQGQCGCYNGSDLFCGLCPADGTSMECRYCPSGYDCPADPCDNQCPAPGGSSGGSSCPSDAPVNCGNGYCCPTDHAYCCAGQALCGDSPEACDGASSNDDGSDGNSGQTCSTQQACGTVSLQYCLANDGSACFYMVGSNRINCASCQDISSCAQQAANALQPYCK